MTAPVRIQRRRTKGWHAAAVVPNGLPTVYVNRPLRYSNPHDWRKMEAPTEAEQKRMASERFRCDLIKGHLPYTVEDVKRDLAGKNIGCFCSLEDFCHGDVLLRIANLEAR